MIKKGVSLYTKLLLNFGLIIVIMLLIMLGGREIISENFERYFLDQATQKVDELEEVTIQLLTSEGNRGVNRAKAIMQPYSNGLFSYRILDADGNEIITNRKPTPGGGEVTMNDRMNQFREKNPRFKKEAMIEGETRTLTSTVDGQEVVIGTLEVEYYLVNNLLPEDALFIDEFLVLYRWMMVIVAVIGVILMFFAARSISKPIKKVVETTNGMGAGNLQERVDIKSTTREMIILSDAVNQLADTLEEEDHLRKQMSSDMAHEIRTPLNNIRNILEAMIDGLWEPTEENMNRCMDEVLRMNTMIDQLKDIAMIEEKNLSFNDSIFGASSMVSGMVSTFEPEAMKKGVGLAMRSETDVQVRMDAEKLKQILSNLIGNSIRYCYEDSVINVRTSVSGSDFVLVVEDEGIGIEEEHLERIFERFYRTDDSRSKETGGLGLGLTIVKKIVDHYEGHVKVASTRGVGTRFSIHLPIIHN